MYSLELIVEIAENPPDIEFVIKINLDPTRKQQRSPGHNPRLQ